MTFLQLQKLVRSRLGEVAYFEVGQSTIGDSSNTALGIEINRAYQNAVNILDLNGHYRVIQEEDYTLVAGDASMDMTADLTYVPRKVLFVGYYPGGDTSRIPVPCTFPFGGSRKRQLGAGGLYWPENDGPREMWMDGMKIGVFKSRSADTVLHIRYVPEITEMSSDSDTPDQVSPAHHEYIGQLAAVNMATSEPKAAYLLRDRLAHLEILLRQVESNINQYTPDIVRGLRR